jgi:precorrin-2 dehydrogenase/sirohydrochlorin ferrochelatase
VNSLLEAGAEVAVVAPAVSSDLAALRERDCISLALRPYTATDLNGITIVIAATDSTEINQQVVSDAKGAGVWVCDAETPENGDFIVPSTVRRGDLLISIATGGNSPALSARLRKEIEEQYGAEYSELVRLLGEARSQVLSQISDPARRRDILRLLADEPGLLDLIREGRVEEARERVYSCISQSSV